LATKKALIDENIKPPTNSLVTLARFLQSAGKSFDAFLCALN